MAKGAIAKLAKLKCILKRWHSKSSCSSFSSHNNNDNDNVSNSQSYSTTTTTTATNTTTNVDCKSGGASGLIATGSGGNKVEPVDLHPVYVGSSRRRYLISSHLMHHPLLRALLLHDGGGDVRGRDLQEEDETSPTVVGCEVVLFDHLLWMLENADQPESLDDLVDFYSCCGLRNSESHPSGGI